MTSYHQHGVTLSSGQREKLSKALASRSGITLRLSNSELNGNDKLLTKTQIKKLNKSKSQGKGADLKLSVAQIRNMVQKGGSLISTLLSLGTRALPFASKFATKVLPGLATGALSSLGNFGMDKILGQRQTGGFMIPQSKIDQLIAYKHLLTAAQKKQITSAIQSGGKLVIKPTKKQNGGFLGSLLASIGIPILLNALTGKGLQNRKTPSSKKGGKGLQNRKPPINMSLVPYRPPPLIGNWGKSLGSGLQNRRPPTKKKDKGVKKKRKRTDTGTKFPIQKHTTSRPNFVNKPISNFDIKEWIKYLKIKYFNGVYSRDQISNQQSIGFYIVNMDDSIGQGIHWIALRIKPDRIEYFDSFGIRPPREVKVLAKALNLPYVYNSTQ